MPSAGAHTISRFVDRRFHLVDDVDRHNLLFAIEQASHRWDWLWLSRRRRAATARLVIGVIATRDFGQSYATVAARLSMRTGSLFNLLARRGADAGVDTLVAELRQQLAAK